MCCMGISLFFVQDKRKGEVSVGSVHINMSDYVDYQAERVVEIKVRPSVASSGTLGPMAPLAVLF